MNGAVRVVGRSKAISCCLVLLVGLLNPSGVTLNYSTDQMAQRIRLPAASAIPCV